MKLLNNYGKKVPAGSAVDITALRILNGVKRICKEHQYCADGCIFHGLSAGCYINKVNIPASGYSACLPSNWNVELTVENNCVYNPGISEICDVICDMTIDQKLRFGIIERKSK